jgi:hypothetical protein
MQGLLDDEKTDIHNAANISMLTARPAEVEPLEIVVPFP